MYAQRQLVQRPQAQGMRAMHIRQITNAHVTTITCTTPLYMCAFLTISYVEQHDIVLCCE